MKEIDNYRRAYVNEQEEEMDYVPELDDIEPFSPDDEWEDWPEDDQEYYDSLCKEFTFLMENNL